MARDWQRWWLTVNGYLLTEIGKSLDDLIHVPFKLIEKLPPRKAATAVENLIAAGMVTLRPRRQKQRHRPRRR